MISTSRAGQPCRLHAVSLNAVVMVLAMLFNGCHRTPKATSVPTPSPFRAHSVINHARFAADGSLVGIDDGGRWYRWTVPEGVSISMGDTPLPTFGDRDRDPEMRSGRMATLHDKTLSVRDADGSVIAERTFLHAVGPLVTVRDGWWLKINDHQIAVLDLDLVTKRLVPWSGVYFMASRDGAFVATSGSARPEVWSGDGQLTAPLDGPLRGTNLTGISADGSRVVALESGRLTWFDRDTKEHESLALPVHPGSVSVSASGDWVAFTGSSPIPDPSNHSARLWLVQLSTQEVREVPDLNPLFYTAMDFNGSETKLAVPVHIDAGSTGDRSVGLAVVDVASSRSLQTRDVGPSGKVRFDPSADEARLERKDGSHHWVHYGSNIGVRRDDARELVPTKGDVERAPKWVAIEPLPNGGDVTLSGLGPSELIVRRKGRVDKRLDVHWVSRGSLRASEDGRYAVLSRIDGTLAVIDLNTMNVTRLP